MSTICKCNDGISNTGLPLCTVLEKVIKKVVFVQLQANDGTLNYIDPSTTLDSAWLTAKLNNSDKSKRFFPTPEIKNIDTPKDAPVFEKYKDDSSYFVRESVRKFKGLIPSCPPMYKSQLESLRCNLNVGCYLIDLEGNWRGITNEADGFLYPFPLAAQSVIANVVNANDDNTQQIDFEFEFPASLKDGNMRMISSNGFSGFTNSSITGLLVANYALVGSVTATSFVVDITTPSPALDQPIACQGWVAADFVSASTATTSKIWDVTDSTDKAITVAESATKAGRYTVTYTSISGKTLTLAAKKNGFDTTNFLSGSAIVTP